MEQTEDAAAPADLLAPLVGTWEGQGEGTYPSIDPFSYREVLEIQRSPKGFLTHQQRTAHAVDGRPLHAEVGYWRVVDDTWVELVLAHPTGVAEVCEGPVDGALIHLRSVQIACTPSAKPVETLERWYDVGADVLRYRLSMGAAGQDHQPHLEGELRRVS